jgi:hypothetical protein
MALPERALVGGVARSAGSHSVRTDPQIVSGQRVAVLAVGLAQVQLVLGVGDELEMVWVPARVHAAPMMKLLVSWNVAAKELPAEPVGVAVLCLGDAAVGRGRPGEPPAGAELGVGRFEDGVVEQPFQLGAASSGSFLVLSLHRQHQRLGWARSNHMPGARHVGRGLPHCRRGCGGNPLDPTVRRRWRPSTGSRPGR